jgi:hypothetical protein
MGLGVQREKMNTKVIITFGDGIFFTHLNKTLLKFVS